MVLGLLPREFDGKIKAVGNSSLGGALRYLINDDSKERLNCFWNIHRKLTCLRMRTLMSSTWSICF